MEERRVCFYHRGDLDGKCSGAIVLDHFEGAVEVVGINYGDNFEKIVFGRSNLKDEIVIMIDFCLEPWDLMPRLQESCRHLIWIDHHSEAIKKYESWQSFPERKIDGIREIGLAGCELAWRFFNNDDHMPEAVRLIGRYDVWNWENVPGALEFQMGMRLVETMPDKSTATVLWKSLLRPLAPHVERIMIDQIIDDGKVVLRYKKQQDSIHIKSAGFELDWFGKKWIAINEMYNNSELFNELYDPSRHHGMLAFGWRKGNWHISLYTTRDDVDCGAIATEAAKRLSDERYKATGGGHRKAAGFQSVYMPFDVRCPTVDTFCPPVDIMRAY
jgi:hypothetical protein